MGAAAWVGTAWCWQHWDYGDQIGIMGSKPNVSKQPWRRVVARCCWLGRDLGKRGLLAKAEVSWCDLEAGAPQLCPNGAEHSQTQCRGRPRASQSSKILFSVCPVQANHLPSLWCLLASLIGLRISCAAFWAAHCSPRCAVGGFGPGSLPARASHPSKVLHLFLVRDGGWSLSNDRAARACFWRH